MSAMDVLTRPLGPVAEAARRLRRGLKERYEAEIDVRRAEILESSSPAEAAARAQGAIGFGPVTTAAELPDVFARAIAAVDAGNVVVVDVRVEPGYTAATTAAMTRKGD